MKRMFYFLTMLVLIVSACQKNSANVNQNDVSSLTPKQVVRIYYESWNNKNYEVMYSLISDGFKQIEPTAKTFDDFKNYMSKFYDTSTGIEIVEIKESYQNDKESGVNYKINVVGKNGKKTQFGSIYTLKKRANGWKLIHPYGNNIDTN